MEVNGRSFPYHLLGIIKNISEADFVSFDLEMSGIPSGMHRIPPKGRQASLEDRYAEGKASAERYQILQVGITCGKFEWAQNQYVLRPYNFNISPMVQEKISIERDISFQTGAIAFLFEHGFQFDQAFRTGVQYLSREEAAHAKQNADDRLDKKNVVEDVHLKATDVEALDFMKRVRDAIAAWKATNSFVLEITSHTGLQDQPDQPVISRFEKRLVHQLVRAESPYLIATGRDDHILIKKSDPVQEAAHVRRKKAEARGRIAKQTGFRWVVEAMAHGDIEVDPAYFARDKTGEPIAADFREIKSSLGRSLDRLKNKQPVLVGHNMFLDLLFFYQTFIGQLPDTLDCFCDAIHTIFPRIIDTKYLDTFDGGDLHASPPLEEVARKFADQPLPKIVTDPAHSKYFDMKAPHEAGYDSLQTATILLRVSTDIQANRWNGVMSVNSSSSSVNSFATAFESLSASGQDKPPVPELPAIKEEDYSLGHERNKKKRKKKNRGSKQKEVPVIATENKFERLRILGLISDNKTESDEEETEGDRIPSSHSPPQTDWQNAPDPVYDIVTYPIPEVVRAPMEMMPDFDSDFWRKFGNRLRIFGTQETVLNVGKWPMK
ncbi:ribonuclease H-like domain-containing protein [Dendryphion nanum]|uniref:Ribonuclease H-like domain-containing protein n=1 Tax=Dendryphion nanum TaxID=256645 RepID=A0A9P9DER8_9PLEO|nr:ribonuclease H-like domain-containing protein [Dendryphion nanum]